MKKELLSVLLMLLPMLASADAVEINGIWYNLVPKAKEAEVTSNPNGSKYSGSIEIPASVTYNEVNYSVTSIGLEAFYQCYDLTSVTIPNSVTSISSSAFSGCSGLTSITIPNSVTSISSSAFSGCSSLTSVTIPNSVTSIGEQAFATCYELTDVYCQAEKLRNNSGSGEGLYTSPDAFEGSYPEHLHVPAASIEAYRSTEPWSLFKEVVALEDGETVEINGIWYNLVHKAKEAEVTSNPNDSKYSGSIEIPASVIYNEVNYSVTFIGNHAFYDCYGLTSVTIPNSVTSIGQSAFAGCSGLTSVTIPNSVTSIGGAAFSGCSGLTSVTIPNSVTFIGDYAFYWCFGLTSVTIPNSVISIGQSAFYNCSGLTSVTIPNSVTSIGFQAFSGCSGLTSVTIPNSVISIGQSAFAYCRGLTSFTIPNSVTDIGMQAFANCDELTDVYCQAEKLRNNSGSGEGLYTSPDAFKDSDPQTMTVHVPAASIEAYRSTEPWSLFKEVVALEGGDTPAAQKCATPEISYADGKLEFTCTTEGVEFVSEVTVADAKKYYDASVTLSQTYKVKVYATKAGYEDSDVATREIVLGSGQASPSGDINNDSKVNIADVVMLLDIILNK